jgi:predicted nucleic acid-binding protein
VPVVLTLPNTRLVAPSYAAAQQAARLRARYGVGVPDALLVATAHSEQAEAFRMRRSS